MSLRQEKERQIESWKDDIRKEAEAAAKEGELTEAATLEAALAATLELKQH